MNPLECEQEIEKDQSGESGTGDFLVQG